MFFLTFILKIVTEMYTDMLEQLEHNATKLQIWCYMLDTAMQTKGKNVL